MLGFVPEIRYDEGSVRMEEGDLVVFYTDGVTEESRDDDEQFGEERMIETVLRHREEPAHQIVEAVRGEVARFSGRETFADDFTLIVLRAGGGAPA